MNIEERLRKILEGRGPGHALRIRDAVRAHREQTAEMEEELSILRGLWAGNSDESLEALARKLRAASEWSSPQPWEHVLGERRERWMRFAQFVQELIQQAVVTERMEVRENWREATAESPVQLNISLPTIPGSHYKALRGIFKCVTDK